MYLSKIWLSLLVLAVVGTLGAALIIPHPAARQNERLIADNLDRGQHNVDLLLRLEMRDWIDAAASMAKDGNLIEVLEAVNTKKGDLKGSQAKMVGRMLSLLNRFKKGFEPQIVIVVDSKGKQIARIGPGDNKYTPGQDGLIGFPIVEATLRGLHGDDTWSLDDKLYFIAGSPVLSRNKTRYIGALIIGQEVNDAFARQLKVKLLGFDLAFFLRGKLLGSTINASELNKLPSQYSKLRQKIIADKKSPTVTFEQGNVTYQAIMAPLQGEAANHDAFYATIGPTSYAMTTTDLLSLAESDDLSWSSFPWLLLVGLCLVLLTVSFFLLRWEIENPLRDLHVLVTKLYRREVAKIDETRFPGRLAAIAKSCTDIAERSAKSSSASSRKEHDIFALPESSAITKSRTPSTLGDLDYTNSDHAGLDLMSPSGVHPLDAIDAQAARDYHSAAEMSGLTTQSESSPKNLSRPATSSISAIEDFPAVSTRTSQVKPLPLQEIDEESLAQPGDFPLDKLDYEPNRLDPVSMGMPSLETEPLLAASLNKNSNLLPNAQPQAQAPSLPQLQDETDLPSVHDNSVTMAKVKIPIPAGVISTTLPSNIPSTPSPKIKAFVDISNIPTMLTPLKDLPMTALAPLRSTPRTKEPIDEKQKYWREVFEEFLAIKRQCGENISNITFEKFALKLQKNQDELMSRLKCSRVKFQVYIKEGKAALKATPVKD